MTGLRRAWLVATAMVVASTLAALAQTLVLAVATASAAFDQRTGQPVIQITLTPASRTAFAEFTAQNVGRKTDVRIDGKSVLQPIIREPITAGIVQISGDLTSDDAVDVARRLSDGSARIEVELIAD
jgi:preprotein translocase subunit SecD